jgi:transcriptional regulator of arginine metabolism
MSKSFRQGQILKLIRTKRISTQEELASDLKALGINATQVTLSRDIRDLRLAKTREGYQEMTAEEETRQPFSTIAADYLTDVRSAQNLVVLRTASGHANFVAVSLDNEEWPEIVGTIAGDDTILVIAPDRAAADALCEKFLGILRSA